MILHLGRNAVEPKSCLLYYFHHFPLSLFALSDCSSPAAPGCDHNMPEKQQLTSLPSHEANSAGNNQFLSFLFEVWLFAAAGLKSSCHTLTFPDTHPGGVTTSAECCGDDLDSHSLTGQWGLNEEPLHTWCHATSGSKPPTLRAVPPSGRVQSWATVGFQDNKMCPELWARLQPLTFQWYFRWTDPSNDSSPRVMFSNERLLFFFFFFDSLHDRSRRRQALSAFLILTFSSSWGWTWLAPAHPAPGEMTHSLFFQNTVKYFDLWASDWPTSSYTQSLWHDTAHLNGSCSLFRCTLIRLLPQRHAWPLHDEPTFWMCVVLSQKSSPKNGYVPFSRCLTEVGLHDAFVWLCETQLWTRGSVNVQCSEKKKVKRDTSETSKSFFFFCIFQVMDKIFMSLFQQCADRQIDI